jgi:hypothetical protein
MWSSDDRSMLDKERWLNGIIGTLMEKGNWFVVYIWICLCGNKSGL